MDVTPAHRTATEASRYDLVERHSGYEKACEHQPKLTAVPTSGAWAGLIAMIVFTAVLVGGTLLASASLEGAERTRRQRWADLDKQFDAPLGEAFPGRSDAVRRAPVEPAAVAATVVEERRGGVAWILWIWAPLCLVGLAVTGAQVGKANRFMAAPIRRVIGVVVDERVEVRGGGKNSAARTHYHATLQTRDGSRTEYECEGLLAGRIAAPDIGVAFIKADHLVDFIRFDV